MSKAGGRMGDDLVCPIDGPFTGLLPLKNLRNYLFANIRLLHSS